MSQKGIDVTVTMPSFVRLSSFGRPFLAKGAQLLKSDYVIVFDTSCLRTVFLTHHEALLADECT